MNPEEFLGLAKDLDGRFSPSTEVMKRTSVSRAYYFVLLKIRLELEKLGAVFQRSFNTHQEVSSCLDNIDIVEAGIVSSRLETLKFRRNEADYELDKTGFEMTSTTALLAINESEAIIKIFQNINKNLIRAELAKHH